MNYANIYREKTSEELVMILENVDELSYEAKTALYDFLQNEKPSDLEVSDDKIEELRSSYLSEDEDISSLKYLSNLGFKIKGSVNEIEIRRSRSAIIVDVISFVIGLLLISKLYPGYQSLNSIISEFELMKMIGGIINLIIGFGGLALLFRALNRVMEYMSFRIKKVGNQITITRLDELKKRTYQVEPSAIVIDHAEGATTLSFLANDQKIQLFHSEAGRVLQNTIDRLGNLLKE